ncbi:MAG: hypothetical protein HRT57_15865 [Crocinitomicaceae bacterium]|nr:hypothetical protein [Crocinitomicaceae bacterium]
MNNKLKIPLKWVIVYPLMLLLCFEIALRILGYSHFHNDDYSIKSSPKNAFVGHNSLGVQLNPGRYSITLNKKVNFVANHEKGNHRLVPGNENPESPDVLFLGCSFTYGYGVNDDQNFPALIQKQFPKNSIRNSGVIGYGTVQSLMQLKEELKRGKLKAVLLNFSTVHFMRNCLSQQYRSNLKIGYERSSSNVSNQMKSARFPYKLKCDLDIQFEHWDDLYSNMAGREWLASMNWFQSAYDNYQDGKNDGLEVTECLIKEMHEICKKQGVKFAVIFLDFNKDVKTLRSGLGGIPTLKTDFNFKSKKLTNLPYDSHPNKRGHTIIANKIEPFLKDLMNEK